MASVSVRRTGACAAAGMARTTARAGGQDRGSKGVHDTATLLMNTSSSDAGTSRTLVTDTWCSRRRCSIRAGGRPRCAPVHRTWIRSPKLCVSATPGSVRSASSAVALRPREDFDDGARQALAQRLRRVHHEQPSVREQRDARATLGLVEVGRRHDDGDALGEELGQQLPELAARHRVDAGRRLVEQDDLRLVDERARERELLLHAARQPIGQPVAERRELRHVEQPVAPLLVVAEAVDLGEERDVLVDAEVAVEAEPLREVADRRA